MEEPEYRSGGVELLDAVEPLWEELRAHHAACSVHFGANLEAVPFRRRREAFERKAREGGLHVEVVRDGERDVAYCVGTIDASGVAEVESIFVAERFRGRGIGYELMRRVLAWMDVRGARRKVLGVGVGNERAGALYERFGFRPRTVIWEQVRE